jgi:hypothetical protein
VSEVNNHIFDTIDRTYADKPAATRRQLVAGAAAAMGSMGLLGFASDAKAQTTAAQANSVETLTAVAATAEILATIVNTVGFQRLYPVLDETTRMNVAAAAFQEKAHYELLVSPAVGAKEVTKRIWVPNAVFASREAFLTTLVVGDQLFINAYLLATTVFARQGNLSGSRFARYAAEIMGVEAVHRALALQSLGRLGNDRVFMKFAQKEEVPGLPTTGQPGLYTAPAHVAALESLGFGFGKEGSAAGAFYDYDAIAPQVPNLTPQINTFGPS